MECDAYFCDDCSSETHSNNTFNNHNIKNIEK